MKPIVNKKYRIINNNEGIYWRGLEFLVLKIIDYRSDIGNDCYEMTIKCLNVPSRIFAINEIKDTILSFTTIQQIKSSKLPSWF